MGELSSSVANLARRYAAVCLLTHAVFISFSLIPAWRFESLDTHGDAPTYLAPGRNLAAHGVFSRDEEPPYRWEAYRTPGYPLLIATSSWLFGDSRWTLYFAAMTAGVAAWCGVRLVALWGGRRAAQHAAGVILACLPNSLGLAAQYLTDAVFGHLVLVWVYLLWVAVTRHRTALLALSLPVLWMLQATKPTFNIAPLLVLGFGLLVARSRTQWTAVMVVLIASLPIPLLLAAQNRKHHEIFAPSLQGTKTVREYMHARYLRDVTGDDLDATMRSIRLQDLAAAEALSSPASLDGRLDMVRRREVRSFLRDHPVVAMRLAVTEMVRQFAAPQEFAVQIFAGGDLPVWVRVAGSVVTLAFWFAAAAGGWALMRAGTWRPGLLVLGFLAFFLVTASVSTQVGARLRFPADMVAVPLCAVGLAALAAGLKHRSLRIFSPAMSA